MKRPIQMRVEDVDYQAWTFKARQAGLTISEWIRRKCNGQDITIDAPPAQIPQETPPTEREAKVDRLLQSSDKTSVCKHGTKKGYRCWQCGGKAVPA